MGSTSQLSLEMVCIPERTWLRLTIEFEECGHSHKACIEWHCQYFLPLDPGESVNIDFLPLRSLPFIRCDTPISWTHPVWLLFDLFEGPSMVSDSFGLSYCCIHIINNVCVREEGCVNFGVSEVGRDVCLE